MKQKDLSKNLANCAVGYAPGKFILVGEHAAVYGTSAIAMPIDHGIRIAILPIDARSKNVENGPFVRGLGILGLDEVSLGGNNGPKAITRVLEYLVEKFGQKVKEISILVDRNLPRGCGLGSSASFSVSLLRALNNYFSLDLDSEKIFAHVSALETIFHGNPSGIDHSVILYGHPIGFKNINGAVKIWPIELKCDLKFAIGLTGPHDGTKNSVEKLRERKKRNPKIYEHIFDGLDGVAKKMQNCLEEGYLSGVGELMNIAQGYLSALHVSSGELDKLCSLARSRGALGAKLTGAGGGGAVIALADNNQDELVECFRAAGFLSFKTTILKDGLGEIL